MTIGHPGDTVPYGERLWRFFTTLLPEVVRPSSAGHACTGSSGSRLGSALYLGVLGASLWLIWLQRRAPTTGRRRSCLLIAAVFPFVYAIVAADDGHLSRWLRGRVDAGPVSAHLLAWIRSEEQADRSPPRSRSLLMFELDDRPQRRLWTVTNRPTSSRKFRRPRAVAGRLRPADRAARPAWASDVSTRATGSRSGSRTRPADASWRPISAPRRTGEPARSLSRPARRPLSLQPTPRLGAVVGGSPHRPS